MILLFVGVADNLMLAHAQSPDGGPTAQGLVLDVPLVEFRTGTLIRLPHRTALAQSIARSLAPQLSGAFRPHHVRVEVQLHQITTNDVPRVLFRLHFFRNDAARDNPIPTGTRLRTLYLDDAFASNLREMIGYRRNGQPNLVGAEALQGLIDQAVSKTLRDYFDDSINSDTTKAVEVLRFVVLSTYGRSMGRDLRGREGPPPSSQLLGPPPSSNLLGPPPASQLLGPPPSSNLLGPPPSGLSLRHFEDHRALFERVVRDVSGPSSGRRLQIVGSVDDLGPLPQIRGLADSLVFQVAQLVLLENRVVGSDWTPLATEGDYWRDTEFARGRRAEAASNYQSLLASIHEQLMRLVVFSVMQATNTLNGVAVPSENGQFPNVAPPVQTWFEALSTSLEPDAVHENGRTHTENFAIYVGALYGFYFRKMVTNLANTIEMMDREFRLQLTSEQKSAVFAVLAAFRDLPSVIEPQAFHRTLGPVLAHILPVLPVFHRSPSSGCERALRSTKTRWAN